MLKLMQSMQDAIRVYQKLMQWYVIQYAFLWRGQFKNVDFEELNQLTSALDTTVDNMNMELDHVCETFQLESIDQLYQAITHEEQMLFAEIYHKIVNYEQEMKEWNRKMDVITDAKIAMEKNKLFLTQK